MSQAVSKSTAVEPAKHRFSRSTGALLGKAGGKVRVPRGASGPDSYAMTGSGDCMEPLIRDGETIVCDPGRKPKAFDLVVIYLRGGTPLIKRLRSSTLLAPGEHLICECDNPERMYRIPSEKIQRVHVVTYNVTQKKNLLDLPYEREFISIPVSPVAIGGGTPNTPPVARHLLRDDEELPIGLIKIAQASWRDGRPYVSLRLKTKPFVRMVLDGKKHIGDTTSVCVFSEQDARDPYFSDLPARARARIVRSAKALTS